MTDSEERALLEEYRANVELWKHDDMLRQSRTGNFLSVNSILLATFCGLISIKPGFVSLGFSALLIGLFGIPMSLVWYSVMARNSDYIRLRRFQLRAIEACFPRMSTFRNTNEGLYKHQPLSFECTDEVFKVSRASRRGSTVTENVLPMVMVAVWGVVLGIGMVSAVVTLVRTLSAR